MADVITLNEIEELKSLLESHSANISLISGNVTSILSTIGLTTDTGGSATAGTAMAKLNSLLTVNTTHGSQKFTSSGTWTCPTGVGLVYVFVVGGGGGGGKGGNCVAWSPYSSTFYDYGGSGGTGGSGGLIIGLCAVNAGTGYAITVGSAGSAASAGGTSKFGSFLSASGGYGGSSGKNGTGSGSEGAKGADGAGGTPLLSSAETIVLFAETGAGGLSKGSGGAGGSGGTKASTTGKTGSAGTAGAVFVMW